MSLASFFYIAFYMAVSCTMVRAEHIISNLAVLINVQRFHRFSSIKLCWTS